MPWLALACLRKARVAAGSVGVDFVGCLGARGLLVVGLGWGLESGVEGAGGRIWGVGAVDVDVDADVACAGAVLTVAFLTSGLRPPRPPRVAAATTAARPPRPAKGRSRWSIRAAAVPGDVVSRRRLGEAGACAVVGFVGAAAGAREAAAAAAAFRSFREGLRTSFVGLVEVFAGEAALVSFAGVASFAAPGRLFSGLPSSCCLSCFAVLAAAAFSLAAFLSRRC